MALDTNWTAKRWVDKLTPGVVNTWDLLKKDFIQRYCPPSKTAKRLEYIHNFKQEIDESLYQAWERFNDLLYNCPTHDIKSHQKVKKIYKGFSTMNKQLLESHGPIPGMTPTQALIAIQTMADHSQKWHDETLSRSLSSSSNTDGLAAIVSKLDNLGRDMKKLKENVHVIQVGCQICERPHLDKECPLNEEAKQVGTTEILQHNLPPTKQNLRDFTQPCTIGNFNFYAMADLGASINVIPKGIFDFLKLTNLRKTNMLIEMADMTKNAPLGVVENVLVGIDKFLFPSDFVIIDRTPNEIVILGRPFLSMFLTGRLHLGFGGGQLNYSTWGQSYAESYKANSHDNKPRPRDYSFKEWMIVKVSHTNVNESVKKAMLKSWMIDYFEEALDPDKDPRGRSFDDYKWVFDLEIEQLANEYELGIGRKGHMLAMI
ncbi:hypothetical protein Tco_0640714 [Tanacetum coccineum]